MGKDCVDVSSEEKEGIGLGCGLERGWFYSWLLGGKEKGGEVLLIVVF